jgi:hypothetical protein
MNARGYPYPSLFGSRLGSTASALALAIRSLGLSPGKCQQHSGPKLTSFNTNRTELDIVSIRQMRTRVAFYCSPVARRNPVLSDRMDVGLPNKRTLSFRKHSGNRGQIGRQSSRPELFALNHSFPGQTVGKREDFLSIQFRGGR